MVIRIIKYQIQNNSNDHNTILLYFSIFGKDIEKIFQILLP
jgi:hypothetical protein